MTLTFIRLENDYETLKKSQIAKYLPSEKLRITPQPFYTIISPIRRFQQRPWFCFNGP